MSVQPPELPGASSDLSFTTYELAGFGQRFVARFIDSFLTAVPAALLFVTTRSETGVSWLVGFYLVLFGLSFLNDVVITTVKGGSIGKLFMGTRVVELPDRRAISAGTAGRRWASMAVMNFIPLLGLIDDLWIFTGHMRQTLHDKFALTIVVTARSA
jgi:uncharacterized RDD family membrane protein YckC